MANEKRGGLPLWAKIVIAAVILFFVGGATLVIGGAMFFGNMAKHMADPAYAAQVISKIADVQNPLPAGVKYQGAMEIAEIPMVLIQVGDNTVLTLMKYPSKQGMTAEQFAQEMAEKGTPSPGQASSRITVTSKGKQNVGGEEMAYVLGNTSARGKDVPALIGGVVPKGKDKTVLIMGQTNGAAYDMAGTEKFLGAIKSF
jgi:hypothetical protein